MHRHSQRSCCRGCAAPGSSPLRGPCSSLCSSASSHRARAQRGLGLPLPAGPGEAACAQSWPVEEESQSQGLWAQQEQPGWAEARQSPPLSTHQRSQGLGTWLLLPWGLPPPHPPSQRLQGWGSGPSTTAPTALVPLAKSGSAAASCSYPRCEELCAPQCEQRDTKRASNHRAQAPAHYLFLSPLSTHG